MMTNEMREGSVRRKKSKNGEDNLHSKERERERDVPLGPFPLVVS
jgi:hypothetical protein